MVVSCRGLAAIAAAPERPAGRLTTIHDVGRYLVMLYLVIGIMEAWSNPPQRLPALIQTGLVVVFVANVLVFSRKHKKIKIERV